MNTLQSGGGGISMIPVEELKEVCVQKETQLCSFNLTDWVGRITHKTNRLGNLTALVSFLLLE